MYSLLLSFFMGKKVTYLKNSIRISSGEEIVFFYKRFLSPLPFPGYFLNRNDFRHPFRLRGFS